MITRFLEQVTSESSVADQNAREYRHGCLLLMNQMRSAAPQLTNSKDTDRHSVSFGAFKGS
nr:hypothetical protein JVH1_6645 [Rhodococcus sp. JVH1]